MRLHRLLSGLAIFAYIGVFATSAVAQGGELVRAEWGVPGNRVDVTARVRTFIHDGVLQFDVTRFNLGIDPAPHQNKDLIIRVRHWDGRVEEYKYPERSNCLLELHPEGQRDAQDRHDWDHDRDEHRRDDYEHHERGLRILRASYGAGDQFVDVTDAVRGYVNDGRVFVRIDNYSMGGDPVPGVHKMLQVEYLFDGERRQIMVDEKTFLRLP